QEPDWLVRAVVDPVGAAAAGRAGDHLAGRQLALALKGPERRAAGQHHDQLLVRVVDVERGARRTGRQLEQRCAELLATRLAADPRPAPGERRLVLLGVERRLED